MTGPRVLASEDFYAALKAQIEQVPTNEMFLGGVPVIPEKYMPEGKALLIREDGTWEMLSLDDYKGDRTLRELFSPARL